MVSLEAKCFGLDRVQFIFSFMNCAFGFMFKNSFPK